MRKISKKSAIKWGVIVLIIAALAALAYATLKPEEEKPNFLTAAVEVGDIEQNVMASGKVKALNTVDVGAQVSGEVKKLYVEVGDEVKQGDLIAQIDQVTQKNTLSNQQATLKQSEAALQSAQAEALSKQASLKSAYADLASRQSELKQAKSDFARLQSLVAIDAISQQEYDTQATTVETAEAAVANASAAIDTAKAAIATTTANINSQQAAIRISETNVGTAEEDLSYTTIRAPISGTVVSITTEQGTTVNASQTAPTLVTLADLSTVRINAQISEADVINVNAGMSAYFNIIGNPDKQYDATLTAIEPAPEEISETSSTDAAIYYVGYVEVPNPERLFRIDMTAQIYIIIDQAKDALLVPSAAIQERPAKDQTEGEAKTSKIVRVLNDDGTVEPRTVEVGIDNRVNAQILSGLEEGEKVIIGEASANASEKRGSGTRIPGTPRM
ncbi:efflux RND transporter periplasmic adaptor subunit [Psychrobacter sp. SCQQ22]|uniref:efflux RND transporter periplasmic adaptor subunit n=1 Tax=Psychrobacter sp. SCQQ22 TaxID=2792059 RepID=UPI0018CD8CF5|nr:efflux RND transporter periplasmic adaptor subunit [Psychrobacter sp. SCQQ22]MBH0087002.1 efflux RND transporter periplasmic adaptor subunit [Psychrobacter sp. SCQQ22]